MEEYRIDIKVRNNLIVKKIEEAGYSSPLSFMKDNGLEKFSDKIYSLINMKITPFDKDGYYHDFLIKICDVLMCSPDDLFTDVQKQKALKNNKKTMEVTESQLKIFLEDNNNQPLLEDMYLENQKKEAVKNAMCYLTPRERKVIEMRNGLGEDGKEYTLQEIAKHFGRKNSESIRQIEGKALRKLRHPSRIYQLRDFCPGAGHDE